LQLAVIAAIGIPGLVLYRRHVERLTRLGDVLGASAVGEEAIVADAMDRVPSNEVPPPGTITWTCG
jgi:hypothetical protein